MNEEKDSEFITRMVEEKEELSIRINKLETYLHFHILDLRRVELFSQQLICMKGYLNVLERRINNEYSEGVSKTMCPVFIYKVHEVVKDDGGGASIFISTGFIHVNKDFINQYAPAKGGYLIENVSGLSFMVNKPEIKGYVKEYS